MAPTPWHIEAPAVRRYPPRSAPPRVLGFREELAAREGGSWVAELFARHRGVSAEVRT